MNHCQKISNTMLILFQSSYSRSNFYLELVWLIFHDEVFPHRKIQTPYISVLQEAWIIEKNGWLMVENDLLQLMMLGGFQTPVQYIMTHVQSHVQYIMTNVQRCCGDHWGNYGFELPRFLGWCYESHYCRHMFWSSWSFLKNPVAKEALKRKRDA